MRTPLHALGRPRALLFTAFLSIALARPAAARDVAVGPAQCALGPLAETAEAGDAVLGPLFDVSAFQDLACPPRPHGPVLPGSPRRGAAIAAGAELTSGDHAGDLAPVGPPLTVGASASPPVRREEGASHPRPDEPLWGVVSELRVGALAHDVIFPSTRHLNAPDPFRHHFERGMNLNAELSFVSPGFLHAIGSPRPRVGGSINTLGYTSNAYVDMDWRYQLSVGPFFEGFLGVAVHDGKLRNANPEFAELGTRFLFHIGLEAGFRFYRRHGLSLFWEHMSNSALAHKNQGMDSTGVRYGYRFAD